MSVRAMTWAFEQPLAGNHKVVLLVLADAYNDEKGMCWPSVGYLADRAYISERTVIRVLQELELAGFIAKEERTAESGRRMSSIFRLAMVGQGRLHPPVTEGGCQNDTLGEGDTRVRGEGDNAVTPYEPKQEPLMERKDARARGSRLTEDWQPSEASMARARQHLDAQAITEELEKFRNYWLAKAGRDAVKLDWGRTFDNWIINAKDRRPSHGPRPTPHGAQRTTARDALDAVRDSIRQQKARLLAGDEGEAGEAGTCRDLCAPGDWALP